MIKKLIVLLAVSSMVFSMAACGSAVDQPYGDYDLSEYVTLGDYKNVEVEKVEAEAVTEEAVESQIKSTLEQNASTEVVEDGAVESGDTVNADYEGKIDGATFEGGSATGRDIIIGSGALIEGFESGLIGKKTGETVTLDLTFPEEYPQDETVAGKAVQFTVKINSISREKIPELNDAFVKTVSKCKTVDEYRDYVRKDLETKATEAARQSMMSAAWQVVFDNAKVNKYPDAELATYEKEMKDYYQQYADSYSMTLAEFLEMAGMTEDEFNKQATEYAQKSVSEEMIMYSIAKIEGIEISDSEYKKGAEKYAENLGYDDVAALEAAYTKETVAASLLWEEFFGYLLDNAKIVAPSADTSGAGENAVDTTAE